MSETLGPLFYAVLILGLMVWLGRLERKAVERERRRTEWERQLAILTARFNDVARLLGEALLPALQQATTAMLGLGAAWKRWLDGLSDEERARWEAFNR